MKHLVQNELNYKQSYLCVIEETDTGYSAFVPDMPGVVAATQERDEIEHLLSEALCLHILQLEADGDDVPAAVTHTYEIEEREEVVFVIPTEPSTVSLAIDTLILESHMKYVDVARAMDVPRSVISRLINPLYRGHSMDSLRKFARALGYEVEVSFKRVD